MRVDLIPASGDGPAIMRKTAGTPAERHRLAREARLVTQAAHPGVVRLLDSRGGELPDSLDFEAVSGQTLADLGPQPLEVAAGIGAAVATTVADLHDLGVCHQSICAEHILIDDRGLPVLCGLGRARVAGDGAGLSEMGRRDVADTAAVISALIPSTAPRALRKVLARAGRGGRWERWARRGRWDRASDARLLARRIVALVPDAHLAGEPTPTPSRSHPDRPGHVRTRDRRRRKVVAIGVAAVVGVGTVVALRVAASPGTRPPRGPVACPAVDDGCGPVWQAPADPAGVAAAGAAPGSAAGSGTAVVYRGYRFRLDAAPAIEVMVEGRWGCGEVALPAVLVPVSGQVWVFRAWPGVGSSEKATLLAVVSQATSMAVKPRSNGCDELIIDRRHGEAVTIDPRSAT